MGKQNSYEHSIKVPLIFRGPNIPQGRCVDTPVLLTDIYPTLCDLLQTEKPASLTGKSFANTLLPINERENLPPHRETLYHMIMDKVRTIRHKEHKLSIYIDSKGNHSITLFNVIKDPYEMENLTEKEPKITENLLEKLIHIGRNDEDRSRQHSRQFWGRFERIQLNLRQ